MPHRGSHSQTAQPEEGTLSLKCPLAGQGDLRNAGTCLNLPCTVTLQGSGLCHLHPTCRNRSVITGCHAGHGQVTQTVCMYLYVLQSTRREYTESKSLSTSRLAACGGQDSVRTVTWGAHALPCKSLPRFQMEQGSVYQMQQPWCPLARHGASPQPQEKAEVSTRASGHYLLDKQPGVASPSKQGRLLQSMFKQGLEGRAQGPSHEVCYSFCHRVVPRNGVLMERVAETL